MSMDDSFPQMWSHTGDNKLNACMLLWLLQAMKQLKSKQIKELWLLYKDEYEFGLLDKKNIIEYLANIMIMEKRHHWVVPVGNSQKMDQNHSPKL